MASESRPKPINMDFIPSTSSKSDTIGMLPPLLTGIGDLPKLSSMALLAARYAGKSMGYKR